MTLFKRVKLPSISAIRKKIMSAEQGSKSAQKWLDTNISRYGKVARTRAQSLISHGYNWNPLQRIMGYTEYSTEGRYTLPTASYRAFSSAEDKGQYLLELRSFLKSESSTLGGSHRIEQRILDSFRDSGLTIKSEDERIFLDYISSDDWDSLKYQQDSDRVIDDIQKLQDNGAKMKDILESMRSIIDSNKFYDTELKDRFNYDIY